MAPERLLSPVMMTEDIGGVEDSQEVEVLSEVGSCP